MVPAGAVIRAVGRRWTPVLAIAYPAFARHMVIVGASGTGKTNLMIRLVRRRPHRRDPGQAPAAAMRPRLQRRP